MSAAPENRGALAGIRVIELGQLIAGPFCGQLLGDMGADVIKVEPPGSGDPMRKWGRGDSICGGKSCRETSARCRPIYAWSRARNWFGS